MLQTAYWLKWPKCNHPKNCGPAQGSLSKAERLLSSIKVLLGSKRQARILGINSQIRAWRSNCENLLHNVRSQMVWADDHQQLGIEHSDWLRALAKSRSYLCLNTAQHGALIRSNASTSYIHQSCTHLAGNHSKHNLAMLEVRISACPTLLSSAKMFVYFADTVSTWLRICKAYRSTVWPHVSRHTRAWSHMQLFQEK